MQGWPFCDNLANGREEKMWWLTQVKKEQTLNKFGFQSLSEAHII